MSREFQAFKDALLVRNVVARVLKADEHEAMEFNTPEALQNYLKKHPKADPKKHTVKKKQEGGGSSKSPSAPDEQIKAPRDQGTAHDMYNMSQGGGALNDVAKALDYGETVPKSKVEMALKQVTDHLDLPDGMKLPGPNPQKNDHAKLKRVKDKLEGMLSAKPAPKSPQWKDEGEKRDFAKDLYEYGGGGNVNINGVRDSIENGKKPDPKQLDHAVKQLETYMELPDGQSLGGPLGKKVDHKRLKELHTKLQEMRDSE